jgi:uncharacterized alkaline shock family protein YloU
VFGRVEPRAARTEAVGYHTASDAQLGRRPTCPCEEDVARVPPDQTPGRSFVTRRAVADVVRAATLGSYGVAGFAGGPLERLLARTGFAQPGLSIHLDGGIDIALDLDVASGVPVAEVARQVDSAVRYGIERTLGSEVRHLVIHIGGLRLQPAAMPPPVPVIDPAAVGLRDLADSGTDVA